MPLIYSYYSSEANMGMTSLTRKGQEISLWMKK